MPVLRAMRKAEKAKSLSKVSHVPDAVWSPLSQHPPSPLRSIENVEDGVGVEVVHAEALLHPEPVAEGDAPAQGEGGQEGDGVGRGEEEEVEDEGEGGDGVEAEIGGERDARGPIGQDQLAVDLSRVTAPAVSDGAHLPRGGVAPTTRSPQYRRLIRHSSGALATLSVFFSAKRRRLRVRSASRPAAQVAVARARPMMVRNCRCQP